MRGRYPRHVWPDDPASAQASLKTKNALARAR
jgi:ATP-dependent helicase HrpB